MPPIHACAVEPHAEPHPDTAIEPNEAAVEGAPVELDVTPDLMSAMLTLTPPRGGNPVTEEDVRAALAASGIIAGILDLTLRDLIAQGECDRVVIAEGKYPVPGRQGHFESLLESLAVRQREDDENAIIDYREMGNLTLVEPGEPLPGRPLEDEQGAEQPKAEQVVGKGGRHGAPGAGEAAVEGARQTHRHAVKQSQQDQEGHGVSPSQVR